MKELIVFYDLNTPTFFIPLLQAIRQINPSIVCKVVAVPNVSAYSIYFDKLKNSGVQFLSYNDYKAYPNHVFLSDGCPNLKERINTVCSYPVLIITYRHASDAYFINKNVHHICLDRHQFQTILSQFEIEANDKTQVKIPQINSEVFLGGYFHYFELLPFLSLGKKELQKRLAEKLGIELNPDLPLISYTVGEFLRENKFADTLEYLSQFYNVIVKELGIYKIRNLSGKNIHICRSRREPLLRFASDVNLVAVASGSLKSSFAFGLRAIPVYSYKMGRYFSQDKPELQFIKNSYCYNLLHYCELNSFQYEYFKLVPPVSIYNKEGIKALIDDRVFWQNFDKKVIGVKNKIFGEINIQESIERTAKYIIDILLR